MSSTYRIVCVSHDPALIIGMDSWTTAEPAIAAIAERGDGPAAGHPDCDLVVGRYSYPLIEVCCTAARSNSIHHGSSHRTDEWISASWLRLLARSTPEDIDLVRLRSCWTRDLVRSLRFELDIELREAL